MKLHLQIIIEIGVLVQQAMGQILGFRTDCACMQKQPTAYVKVLLDVYNKYRKYTFFHLQNDRCFVEALDKVVGYCKYLYCLFCICPYVNKTFARRRCPISV